MLSSVGRQIRWKWYVHQLLDTGADSGTDTVHVASGDIFKYCQSCFIRNIQHDCLVEEANQRISWNRWPRMESRQTFSGAVCAARNEERYVLMNDVIMIIRYTQCTRHFPSSLPLPSPPTSAISQFIPLPSLSLSLPPRRPSNVCPVGPLFLVFSIRRILSLLNLLLKAHWLSVAPPTTRLRADILMHLLAVVGTAGLRTATAKHSVVSGSGFFEDTVLFDDGIGVGGCEPAAGTGLGPSLLRRDNLCLVFLLLRFLLVCWRVYLAQVLDLVPLVEEILNLR